MKGLLLKDLYMTRKYFRSFALLIAVFLVCSVFSDTISFMVLYPCVLAGMIPVNLMSYDSQSRWEEYAGALPYTRAQLVSAKYLLGLVSILTVLALTGICQGLRMVLEGSFLWQELLPLLAMLLVLSLVTPALSMPLLFRLGVEKGRLIYLVFIGVACGGSVFLGMAVPAFALGSVLAGLLPLMCLAAAGLYGISWYVSVRFYQKREL